MGDQRENLPSSPHSSVITRLKNVLADLHSNPSPHIPEPPSCKKRASVALVIRIRAQFPYRSTYNPNTCSNSNTSFRSRLDAFFEQEWVQTGEPEILFMKRAARTGDRWTGHVAFPGGKREAGDADDEEASVRETREEVGLDLRAPHCLQIGNLPQRVITTNWGKVPIMVLCPYVYLLCRDDFSPLSLQPTEVHSAHWVSLRSLLSPHLRSYERSDVSDRLRPQRGPAVKYIIRSMTGQLVFRATYLAPSESLFSTPSLNLPNSIPISNSLQPYTIASRALTLLSHVISPSKITDHLPSTTPLLLWGLTLGIVSDLLQGIDVEATATLWEWPTFSHPDIRILIRLLTWRLRHNMTAITSADTYPGGSETEKSENIDSRCAGESVAPDPDITAENAKSHAHEAKGTAEKDKDGGIAAPTMLVNGIDNTTVTLTSQHRNPAGHDNQSHNDNHAANSSISASAPWSASSSGPQPQERGRTLITRPQIGLPPADLLDEYFRWMRRAVVIAFALRSSLVTTILALIFWRRRRHARGG